MVKLEKEKDEIKLEYEKILKEKDIIRKENEKLKKENRDWVIEFMY